MFCSNCGNKADDNDNFCNECGNKLNKKIEPNTEEEQEIFDENTQTINIEENKKAESFANIIANNNMNTHNVPYQQNMQYQYTQNMPYQQNMQYQYSQNNQHNIPINYNIPTNNQNNIPNENSKKLKKVVAILAVVAIFMFIGLGILISTNEKTNFLNKDTKDRTIMIYMVGSDLESMYGSASSDIKEMINSKADFENINILIYTGGAKKWYSEEIPEDKNAIFSVTNDGLEKLKVYEKKPMGNYKTLTEFLDYGYNNFKAEDYSLIFWDHGGGPIYGFGVDEYNEKNYFTIEEIKKALEKSAFNGKNKLDLIGFDACLMSSAEVAFMLSDYAEYFIASQEIEPGEGWDYHFLKEINTKTTTEEMGKHIIDYYSDFYDKKIGGNGISLSLLKLSKIEKFEKSLNDLFEKVDDNLSVEFSSISRTRKNSKTYGKSAANDYDLVDAYDLIDKLPKKYYEEVQQVKSAIEDLVVYQKTDLRYTNGISLYFPYSSRKGINTIMSIYKDFNFANEYTEFIDNFASKLDGNRLHTWKLEDKVPVSEEVGEISVTVPDDVIENYSNISYIIFEKMDEDYYMPIYKGTDVSISGNTIGTTITDKVLIATTDDNEKIPMTVIESESGVNYKKYIIPGMLSKWGEDHSFSSLEMLSVYVQLIVDEDNPNGKVTGVIPIQNLSEDPLAPKLTVDIKDWDTIQLLTYKYKIFDSNGNYTSSWEGSGEIIGIESSTNDDINLKFEDVDISKDYYCLFRITDSQGNEYTTNVVKIKDK